jgi:DNA-directed RNA polymerase specialized sigma24 family protein
MSGYQKRRVCVTPTDIPTIEELYRSEVRKLPRLTAEDEQELVRRARAGDAEARSDLITSCLNYVGFMAARYKCYVNHDDYLDLVGIGNLAVVEHLDRSLLRDNPCAYLRGVVKYTVLHYCYTHASLISRPQQSAPVYTVSLDTARSDEQPLSQRIAFQESPPVRKHPEYAFLYQALEQLSPQYREVVSCHFGLYDRAPESLYTMSRRMSANVKGTIAYLMMYRALSRMRTILLKGGTIDPESNWTKDEASTLTRG